MRWPLTPPSSGRPEGRFAPFGPPLMSNVDLQSMPTFRALDVRDCQGTLWAFFREYQGQALASFEGDLSGLHLTDIPGASRDEVDALRRQTVEPELDFCIVPINQATVSILKARLSSKGLLGRDGKVIHTQLQVHGELVFSACDNFHRECTVVSSQVTEDFLCALTQQGLLRSYSAG